MFLDDMRLFFLFVPPTPPPPPPFPVTHLLFPFYERGEESLFCSVSV